MSTKILFRLATVVAFICGTATAVAAAANTTWPACYVIGNDYDGDDVISGLRFSDVVLKMLKDISKLKPGTDVIAKIQHDLTLLELNNTQLLEIVSQVTSCNHS